MVQHPTRPLWKRVATLPVNRSRAGYRLARSHVRPACTVLMYHHVADVAADPWQLAVGPTHFEEHLAVLRASRRPLLTVAQLRAALAEGGPPKRSVVVTFDDGYADNAQVALPVLERFEVPATVFVTTGSIDAEREMWWDELERIVLSPADLPPTLHLDVTGVRLDREVEGPPTTAGWRAGVDEPASGREQLHQELWSLLSPLAADEQRTVLDALATWSGTDLTPRATHRMVTSDELDRLARSPMVELGSHTVSHPSLPRSPALEHELVSSKHELEARSGGPVTSFAYPSGHHDHRTVAAVVAAGYLAAAATVGGQVVRGTDPHRLPRLGVGDVDGDTFAWMLSHQG